MEYGNQAQNNVLGVFIGLLVGGIAGAVTMLLLAPQSGKDTRTELQKKGIELRDRTNELVEDTLSQVRSRTNKITSSGRKQIKEIKKHGKELAVEQLDRVSEVVKAGKSAVKSA